MFRLSILNPNDDLLCSFIVSFVVDLWIWQSERDISIVRWISGWRYCVFYPVPRGDNINNTDSSIVNDYNDADALPAAFWEYILRIFLTNTRKNIFQNS